MIARKSWSNVLFTTISEGLFFRKGSDEGCTHMVMGTGSLLLYQGLDGLRKEEIWQGGPLSGLPRSTTQDH